MLTTSEMAGLICLRCKELGIPEVYQTDNLPDTGEIAAERVVVIPKGESDGTKWRKTPIEVNVLTPNVQTRYLDIPRLIEIERAVRQLFKGVTCGQDDEGRAWRYHLTAVTRINSTQLRGIDILKLWHFDPTAVSADLTPEALATLLKGEKVTEVKNVHQDTWNIEEGEASQDSYKNQLTGSVYRMGAKTMGDITIAFTIGQYDYETKQLLLGGDLIKDGEDNVVGWKRARGIVEIKRGVIALTEDGVYIVAPYCNFSAREQNQDGAIGLGVSATVLEPLSEGVHPEYWFDESAVKLS
ncbi:unnamed protein product [Cylicocyclus nassatus]|uniref:Uncharacterized protein n=1 Tax=Cylicocyclus nassatus TaxID=53992 RepID=A0AA36MFD7_CYLNA|nr:unnamed protein product [Cylicocyclus nassatus]